jgi:1-deoxy-D-xylulose-5-phosphate synthase
MDEELKTLPVGQALVLRKGRDLTLLAVGSMVRLAEEVATVLASSGIDAAVINARFVKPLDENCILEYAQQTGRVYTLEEHVLQCGFGSAVMELIHSRGLTGVTVKPFGFPDSFIEHGSTSLLLARYGLTVEQIARSISESFVRKTYPRKLRLAPS